MTHFKVLVSILFTFLLCSPFSFHHKLHATELHLSLAEAKRQGFKIQFIQNKSSTQFQHQRNIHPIKLLANYKKSQLSWPFELPYREGFIGNNFAQYQPYEIPGYHGGNDMVLEKDSWIYAPVNGFLEAGHYAYTDNADGSRIKHWKAWPASGDPSYFELAVIDNEGNRFELHHVDKSTLPKEVIDGLNRGQFLVTADMKLGRVVDWGTLFHYDHVHVNIHDRNGNWYNPEYYFNTLPDSIPPKCQFLVVDKNKKSQWLQNTFNHLGHLNQNSISHFVVIASDQKNGNKFSQVPVYFEIDFEGGEKFFWDFQKNLTSSNSTFADIRNVYPQSVELPNGTVMRQPSGYYPNGVKFAVNLPLPSNTGSGQYTISAKDTAGNLCFVKGKI